VFWFAQVLQILSKGTRSPKIVLPFIPGLEYSKVTSVKPTFCSIFWDGLGAGVLICAVAENAKAATNNDNIVFFIITDYLVTVISKLQFQKTLNVNKNLK